MDTEILHSHCAGLDVHKKTVVACRVSRDDAGCRVQETRTFATMTNDLREMAAWLVEGSATHVAMESTGSYWRPVYNVLEGSFELIVVNPQHVRNLVGRKTDVKDAELIAKLLEHGLLRGSFIPAPEQRDLRDLTRERDNLVRERATVANRIQRVLEAANIKLASVATDVLGASGRAMLRSIVEGEEDPEVLARCARGRLREKDSDLREALTGRLRPQHLIVLTVLLRQVDSLDAGIATLSEAIEEFERPFEEAVQLVDTIPGVAKRLSQTIVSEIGDDMSRFPSAAHLAAWAGVAPGNNVSGGRRLSGKTRKGCPALQKALVQAAHSAARQPNTYLSAQYHRLAPRRGNKRAIVAVAHSIIVDVYYILQRHTPYHELGANYFYQLNKDARLRRLDREATRLGMVVIPAPQTGHA